MPAIAARPILFAFVIVAAIALAWSNSLSAPFLLDDRESIVANETIRDLRSWRWLFPPATGGETVSGRPLLNLSFALNYAVSGLNPRAFRVTNIAIHACAALVLFGIVRRTLFAGEVRKPGEATQRPAFGSGAATVVAFVVTLLWAVHPLQTAAVTYIVQRAESLAALFGLLALYGFIRATGATAASRGPQVRRGWLVVSVVACACGMATKETMVVGPVIVWIYDRAFLAGSFHAAWRAHGRFHLALAATWLVAGALVVSNLGRGGSAGFESGIDPWTYFLTQCRAIVHYLALAAWPASQVFDYGTNVVSGLADVALHALVLLALAGGTAWALVRNRPMGFLGACFFLLLAPSSSIVPVATQTMAEHRMYLALAVPVIMVARGVWAVMCGAVSERQARRPAATLGLAGAIALALGLATYARNEVYRSELTLWQDSVAKRPDNPRAQNNLGNALAAAGELDAAAAAFRRAIALQPQHAFAHFGLGTVLAAQERWDEALTHFQASHAADPAYENARAALSETHGKLGLVRAREQRLAAAAEHFRAALELQPDDADTHANLGNILLLQRDAAGALAHYEAALRLRPDDARLRDNIRLARQALGR